MSVAQSLSVRTMELCFDILALSLNDHITVVESTLLGTQWRYILLAIYFYCWFQNGHKLRKTAHCPTNCTDPLEFEVSELINL